MNVAAVVWLVGQLLLVVRGAQFTLDSLTAFNASTVPSPPAWRVPASANLTIAVAACAPDAAGLRFFVSNATARGAFTGPVTDVDPDNVPGSQAAGADVYEIAVQDGYGEWTAAFPKGGTLAVEGAADTPFLIAVSEGGPISQPPASLPQLGDTTSNQAVLFSPVYAGPGDAAAEPSYPNYTLPAANLTLEPPAHTANYTLYILDTDEVAKDGSAPDILRAACMLAAGQNDANEDAVAEGDGGEEGTNDAANTNDDPASPNTDAEEDFTRRSHHRPNNPHPHHHSSSRLPKRAAPPPLAQTAYTITASYPWLRDPTGGILAGDPIGATAYTRLAVNGITSATPSGAREGWRVQWVLEGLAPGTNYTVFAVQEDVGGLTDGPATGGTNGVAGTVGGKRVGGPIYMRTKSATFPCPLAHSLPFCPGVAHAVPLAFPEGGGSHTPATLPAALTAPLLASLTNFTAALGTFACGRDLYSPLVGCADCAGRYRAWACGVGVPRCGEARGGGGSGDDGVGTGDDGVGTGVAPTATGVAADTGGQVPLSPDSSNSSSSNASSNSSNTSASPNAAFTPRPALVAQPAGRVARAAGWPDVPYAWVRVLPCLELCTAADRACPNFLGFKCPLRRFNAAASYAVGYVDSGHEGGEGDGVVASARDRWGNVWCAG